MKHTAIGATCVLALLVAGCTTSPAEYSAKLPARDAKWNTAECQKMRATAANYDANEKKTMGVAAGMVFGPYGVAIALAGKDYKAKQRKLFVRDMHIACSSEPLPPDLQNLTGRRAS